MNRTLKTIYDFCETCSSHDECPEEECMLFNVEQSLLDELDYYDNLSKQGLKYLCAITKAQLYLDHLRKDCKYRLNEGHLRKLEKILQEPFKEPTYLESGSSNE